MTKNPKTAHNVLISTLDAKTTKKWKKDLLFFCLLFNAKPEKTAHKPSEKADDDQPTVPELRGIKEIERLNYDK